MPTDENKTVSKTNNNGAGNQSDPSGQQNSQVGQNEEKKIDKLDIDLDLDGIDVPEQKKEVEIVSEEKKDEEQKLEAEKENSDKNLQKKDETVQENVMQDIKKDEIIDDFKVEKLDPIIEEEKKTDESTKGGTEKLELDDLDLSSVNVENKQDEQVNFSKIDDSDLKNNKKSEVDGEIKKGYDEAVESISEKIDNGSDNEKKDDDRLKQEDKKAEEKYGSPDEKKQNSIDESTKLEEKKVEDVVDNSPENVEKKIDDLSDIFQNTSSEENKESDIQEQPQKEKIDTLNLDDLAESKDSETIKVDKNTQEKQSDIIVENSQGDILSDTVDLPGNDKNYTPNENDFNQVKDKLNSSNGGQIDLGNLEKQNEQTKNKESEKVSQIEPHQSLNGALDLDSLVFGLKTDNDSKKEENISITNDLGNVENQNVLQQTSEEPVQKDIQNENNQNLGNNILEQVSGQNVSLDSGLESSTTNIKNDVGQNQPQNIVENNTPIQTNMQNENTQTSVVKNPSKPVKKKHGFLKFFVFVVLLLVLGFMILSRMYPEEFKSIFNSIKTGNELQVEYSDNANTGVVIDSNLSGLDSTGYDFMDDNLMTGGAYDSGLDQEIPEDSLAGQLDLDNSVSGETLGGADDVSGNLDLNHNSGDFTGFNNFEGLDDVIDSDDSVGSIYLDDLKVYLESGNEFNEWGRNIGNSTAMKYGLYISEKSDKIISDIENGLEIDNTEVENYFAQFDIYLSKLSSLRAELGSYDSSTLFGDNNESNEYSIGY